MVVVHQKAALGLGLGQTRAGISDTGKERKKEGQKVKKEGKETEEKKGEEENQGKKMIEGRREWGITPRKKKVTHVYVHLYLFPIFIHVGNHITVASMKITPSTILLFSIPSLFPSLPPFHVSLYPCTYPTSTLFPTSSVA